MLPVAVVSLWLWSLLSVAVLGVGSYLVYDWWNGWQSERWPLLLGAFLLLLSALGRPLILPLLGRSPRPGEVEPRILREGRMHRLERPDGTTLQLEKLGPAHAPTLVLTHGWGLNGAAWFYAQHWLSPHFRLLLWDLPGLGGSRASRDQNSELPKLAADLAAVVEFAASPVVLVGHSIGGMIMLTFACKFPELLRRQVRGLVLTHTTPHNPVITARYGPVWRALQAPLLKPLCS